MSSLSFAYNILFHSISRWKTWVLVLPFSAANQKFSDLKEVVSHISLCSLSCIITLFPNILIYMLIYLQSNRIKSCPVGIFSLRELRISHVFCFKVCSNCLRGGQRAIRHFWGPPITWSWSSYLEIRRPLNPTGDLQGFSWNMNTKYLNGAFAHFSPKVKVLDPKLSTALR